MDNMRVELDSGTHASCLSAGNGPQSLLLLHGNSLTKETFLPLLDSSLADQYRLLAVDFPGHGETVTELPPDRVYTVEGLVGFVQEVLHALDLSSPMLLGHSLGGHIAIEAAEGIPELKGLLTVGTPPLTFSNTDDSPFHDHPAVPLIFTGELDDEQSDRLSRAYWSDRSDIPSQISEAISTTDPVFRSAIGADVAAGNFKDEVKALSRLSCPVAVAIGEHDSIVNREYIDHVVDRNQVWTEDVIVIEDAGHSPQLEQPYTFNNLVDNFLNDVFGGSGQ